MQEIALSNCKLKALVSDSDYEFLNQFNWWLDASGYPKTRLPEDFCHPRAGRHIYMHKLLISSGIIDHINRVKLDNRRENLRSVTMVENAANRSAKIGGRSGSRFKGVRLISGLWQAQAASLRHRFSFFFKTEIQAAICYDILARLIWGRFAVENIHGKTEAQIDEILRLMDKPDTNDDKSSKFTGVSKRPSGEFYAAIRHNGKAVHIGAYNSEIEAAVAFNNYAIEHQVSVRKLNAVPDGIIPIERQLKRTHSSKQKGVYRKQGGYCAQISRGGVKKFLGTFKTEDEAIRARLEAEQSLAN